MDYMHYPSALPAIPVPQAGDIVTADIPCRRCAYNLRTLSVAGVCPECGAPVEISIYGDLLKFSDPVWLRKLGRGAVYILLGLFLIIGIIITTAVLVTLRMVSAQGSQVYIQLLTFGGYVFSFIGSWLITEPDPSGMGEDKYGTSRKVIRVTLLLGVLHSFLNFVATISLPPAEHQLLQLLGGLLEIAGVVGLYAQSQYLGKLALRIPDPRLAGRANFPKIALTTSYGLLIAFGVVATLLVLGRRRGPPAVSTMAPIGCFIGIDGLALLVFGIMYVFMVDRFRRAFAQQADFAQRMWDSHLPAPDQV
jgi:hypothetical protein